MATEMEKEEISTVQITTGQVVKVNVLTFFPGDEDEERVFLELRQFNTVTGQDGRGIVIPLELGFDLIKGVQQALQ